MWKGKIWEYIAGVKMTVVNGVKGLKNSWWKEYLKIDGVKR